MVWVWRDESKDVHGSSAGDRCATRKAVTSQCKTEEIEPGKFVKKCEKTEEILRECVGKPVEVLHSNKEYTEENVTDHVLNRSSHPRNFEEGSFNFPGLRSDIEAIERQFFGGIESFFDAAEEMSKIFFDIFGERSSPPSRRPGMPVEDHSQVEANNNDNNNNISSKGAGHIDLSGLARDV